MLTEQFPQWRRTRLGIALLTLSLGACAQMVTPTPQQATGNDIAVQAARIRIFSLSPQVSSSELRTAEDALAAARAAAAKGQYLAAERYTQLCTVRLDNIQQRLDQSPEQSSNEQLREQIRQMQGRIADLQAKIAATRKELEAQS